MNRTKLLHIYRKLVCYFKEYKDNSNIDIQKVLSEFKDELDSDIDEEELDRLAASMFPIVEMSYGEYDRRDKERDAFKVGYRKAKEL